MSAFLSTLRIPQLLIAATAVATTILANFNMLPVTEKGKNAIGLICLCILSLNHSIMTNPPLPDSPAGK